MNIKINFKNKAFNKLSGNLILFVDEKFNISGLKKFLSNFEYSYILDLLKSEDLKKNILFFDISSKRKIILISFKKNLNNSDAENLGAKCFDLFSKLKKIEYTVNSESLSNKFKNFVGYFLHGIKLKSYKFERYKTKKDKRNISINVVGKNIPNQKDQNKFKAVEEGTFHTRD